MWSLSELLKGFLWGLGFSIAVGLIGVTYYLNYHSYVQQTQQGLFENEIKYSLDGLIEKYDPFVIDIYKEDNSRGVRVTAGLRNLSSKELFAKGMVISLFDKRGKFVGECSSKASKFSIKPNSEIYYDISCRLSKRQAERVENAKASIQLI